MAVDYDVFVNVRRLDAQDAPTVQKLYKAADFDFRLKPGSAAVDRGIALPTVTDGLPEARPISARSRSGSHCRTTDRAERGRRPVRSQSASMVRKLWRFA